jgi:hypothetical protein
MFANSARKPLQIDPTLDPISVNAGDVLLPQMTPPIQKSGGIGGFLGKAAPVLGVIGDALLAANGRPGIYTPMIAQEREQQRREQNALDQWRQEYDYKVKHPVPVNNDTANDYAFWQSKLTPEQFEQWKQKNYDPIVTQVLPNGQFISAPRSQIGALMGGQSASYGSIPSVSDQASYDAVPSGARYKTPDGHIRIKGGGAGNGAGNFPSGNPLDAR